MNKSMIDMRTIIKITLTIFVITGLLSCQDEKNNSALDQERIDPSVVDNPATGSPSVSSDARAVPVIEFEETRHHFGVIQSGEKVTYSFSFRNTGNAPLLISSAKASCGCTVPAYTREPVQPGEAGSIEVTFDSSGKSGMESKNVTIISNTTPNSTVLTISAEIINNEG
jgi:hypothetical protein